MTQPLSQGLWGVLATPFDDGLEVDLDSLRSEVASFADDGAQGLLALGVFGEAASLKPESHVAGVVAVLDQTAEEILMENPRYLTRVKNYPTFFSFGPELITLDEVLSHGPLSDLRVATVHNGAVHREDTVAGMTFSPAELLSFPSQVMPFYPGDVLSTGTPGAVPIARGDTVGCELGDGLAALTNPVR